MFARIGALMTKELLSLKRDRLARIRLVVPAVVQMLVFGYAATFEVHDVSTIVLDLDRSSESRDLVSHFVASGRFDITGEALSQAEVTRAIDRGDATVGIVVDAGFARSLRRLTTAPLQVIVDGTNSNTAMIALGYIGEIVDRFSSDRAPAEVAGISPLPRLIDVSVEERPWYNPGLDGKWFFVSGLIATITLVLIVPTTAFAIVREREMGTLEQIMVSPLTPTELILGKTLPFFLVGLVEVILVVTFAILWFHIPFVGDPWVFALGSAFYLMSTLSLGVLISTLSSTQQQALAASFIVLNPMFILSGFAFPISAMPKVLQWLTYLDPVRYYLVVIRGTFIKGIGLDLLWPEMLGMATLTLALLGTSVLRFRKSLD